MIATMSRLYTVNKWNKKKFLPADVDRYSKNIFDGFSNSYIGGYNAPSFQLTQPTAIPYINWKDSGQSTIALGQTQSMVDAAGQGFNLDLNESNKLTSQVLSNYNSKPSTGKGKGAAVMSAMASAIPEEPIKIGNRTYKYGAWDVADPLSNLAGNYSNKGGDVLNKAGISMFKAGAQSGNPWVMLAGGLTKATGSLVNFALGGVDEERLKRAKSGIDYFNSYRSLASTNEDVYEPLAMNNYRNPYWGGLFRDAWAGRKNSNLHNKWIMGEAGARSGMKTNIYNIEHNKVENSLRRRTYDFGGPLGSPYGMPFGYPQQNGMTALEYNMMSDYLTMKNKQADNKAGNVNSVGTNVFATGGKIHINPKNKGKFNATKKRTGKTTEELTHSKNPLTRKRAIFAQNARKWRHDFGGPIFAFGGDMETNSSKYSVGQVVEVSEEEADRLKQLGYEFRIVS